jgi:4-hydroxyacetophenone monooxygenase
VNSQPARDEAFIRRAVALAEPNVLRVVLLQITGDAKYAAMKLGLVTGRGGAYSAVGLAPECIDEVREDAARLLMSGRHHGPLAKDDATLRRLLESYLGEPVTDRKFSYYREELAFEPAPFAAQWRGARPAAADEARVVIVGAGLSAIAMGVQLGRLGIPYVILEKRHELGGTWSRNIYPDARVDTISFLYQYKFEQNYPWTEYYARQPEVRRYLEHVARRHGVFDHIRFNSEVRGGRWDESARQWRLDVNGAEMTARFVISATGLFSTPRPLDVPGVSSFRGTLLHTTDWSDAVPVAGRNVAIVGNGSTGVQLLARIAEQARHVYVFQRTPQWIGPTEWYGDPLEPEVRWLLDELPGYWNWFCFSRVVPYYSMSGAQEIDPAWQANGGQVSERNDAIRRNLTAYIEQQLAGRPDLLAKLVPDYPPLARRLVIDNGWYRALKRPNVTLVAGPISAVTPAGITGADGVSHPVDTILAATGFTTTKYVWPADYRGRTGTRLEDLWAKSGPRAYLGFCAPGFPNFFTMYGPNAQTRASGLVAFVEQWTRYIARAIALVLERGAGAIEVTPQAYEAYNDAVDRASVPLVWNLAPQGRNYYLNEHGRQHVSAPWLADHSWEMLREPKIEDFVVR